MTTSTLSSDHPADQLPTAMVVPLVTPVERAPGVRLDGIFCYHGPTKRRLVVDARGRLS